MHGVSLCLGDFIQNINMLIYLRKEEKLSNTILWFKIHNKAKITV